MSATLYDKAFLSKLNSWTEKAKLQVFGPSDERQRLAVLADLNNDKNIKLPFIVLSRPRGYTINNTNWTAQVTHGKKFVQKNSQAKAIIVNAIPITLNYELNVYTRYEEEADALMRELIFNILSYPALKVTIPYLETGLVHESTIRLSSDEVETDKNPMSISNDQIFNYGVDVKIDDAYLWDVRTKDNIGISLDNFTVSYKVDSIVTKEEVDGGDSWVETEEDQQLL